MGKLIAALVSAALIAPLAPAAAAPLPEPGPDYPVVQPGQTATGKPVPGVPLQVSVTQDEVARAGGRGSVYVALTRRTAKGPALSDIKVRLTSPKRTSIRSANAPGWKCAQTKGDAICKHPRLSRAAGLSPIYTVVDVKKSYRKKQARIVAEATWRKGPPSKRSSASSEMLPVYSPLRISLTSATGNPVKITTHSGRGSRQFLLAGRIRGIDGAQVDARWKQLSGPKATMLSAKRVNSVKDRVGQVVQVPNSAKTATYRFALMVDGNGQQVRRTVTVRTRVHRDLGKVNGRNSQFRKLAAASLKRDKTQGLRNKVSNGVKLRAKPGFSVLPGVPTRVRVVTKHKVAAVDWTVGSQPAGRGRSIQVTAPDAPRASKIVRAFVTLRSGRIITESALVVSTNRVQETGADPSPANVATVCSIGDQAGKKDAPQFSLELGDKYTLKIQPGNLTESNDFRDAKKQCKGKGQLNFTKGVLVRGTTVVLTNAEGALSAADGATIDQADWEVPSSFKNPAAGTSLAMAKVDKPVTAGLKDGKWELPSGDLALEPYTIAGNKFYGLAFVPLPGDWAFTPDKSLLSFLNADPEDESLKDGTMRFSQQAAEATDPAGGEDAPTITMSIDSIDDKWESLGVKVANITLGQTADGATIMAAGEGSIDITEKKPDAIEIEIQCKTEAGQEEPACELVNGFFVKNFKIKWDTEVIGVVGEAAVQYGKPAKEGDPPPMYEFGLVGAYKSASDWSLAAVSPSDWDLGDTGLQLTGLAGSLGRKPLPKDKTKSQFFAQFTGGVQGFNTGPGITLKKISASLTNLCPVDEEKCHPGEIHLALETELRANLPGKQDNKPAADGEEGTLLKASAYLNLTEMTFEFEFGFENISVGPDELKVQEAQFVMTNEEQESCTPQGATPIKAATGLYTLQVRAVAEVLGATITIGGTVDGKGSCLWGTPGKLDAGKAGETKSQIFGFTTYPNGAKLSLPTGEDELLVQNKMQISGVFDLNEDFQKQFNIPKGGLHYKASFTFDDKAFSLDMTYLPSTLVVIYSNDTAHMDLNGVGFGLELTMASKSGSLKLFANGLLFVQGGAGTKDSTTPLNVTAGFKYDSQDKQFRATFDASVVTTDGAVDNAFGVDGLVVRKLAASFSVTMPKPSVNIGFNADVTMPDSWVKNVGIQHGTRERLALSLGPKNWCVAIELGEESTKDTAIAVDVANRGFLTAGYFKLMVAPTGCDVPIGQGDTEHIDAGFGFAFNGHLAGAPLTVVINATWTDGLVMKGDLNIPAIDLLAVRISGSAPGTPLVIKFDIDTNTPKYDVKFDGGVAIGRPEAGIGAFVAVKGMLQSSDPDFMNFELNGRGAIRLGPVGADVNQIYLKGHIAKNIGKAKENSLEVRGNVTTHILGIGVNAAVAFDYEHQQLVEFSVTAGASIDIIIAMASGNAQFTYCLGKIGPIDADRGSDCKPFGKSYEAKPAYRVGFFGAYRFLWWGKKYTWVAYDQLGVEGKDTPVPKPTDDPDYIPGVIPSLTPHAMSYGEVISQHDTSWSAGTSPTGQQVWFKTVAGAPVNKLPACEKAQLGAEWDASPENVPAANVNPDPNTTGCGMKVDIASEKTGAVARTDVTCSAGSCVVAGGPLAGQTIFHGYRAKDNTDVKDAKGGRDSLIAGLRTPPGVLPGGTQHIVGHLGNLTAPDGAYRIAVGSTQVFLFGPNGPVWAANPDNAKTAASWGLSRTGLIRGYTSSGDVAFSVGTEAPLDPDKYPVFLFVQDGFQVTQMGPNGPVKVWGWDKDKKCYPTVKSCDPVG